MTAVMSLMAFSRTVQALRRFCQSEAALHEMWAFLSQRLLQQSADRDRFSDQSVDMDHLSLGNPAPTLRRRPIRRAVQQNPDLIHLEADEFGKSHDRQPFQNARVIAPLS